MPIIEIHFLGASFRKRQAEGLAATGSAALRFFTVTMRRDGKGTKPFASLALFTLFIKR